jgi:hypothetical protein
MFKHVITAAVCEYESDITLASNNNCRIKLLKRNKDELIIENYLPRFQKKNTFDSTCFLSLPLLTFPI